MSSTDPLLLCSRASRRLQLLFAPSARPRQAKEEQLALELRVGGAEGPGQLCLEAGTLPAPPSLLWGAPVPAWLVTGDPLGEVAVHLDTLRQLRVPAGSLVQVQNAECPDLVPRLARALPSPLAPRGAALLAPSLAFSLGLPSHLSSLLHRGAGSVGSMGHVLLAPHAGPPTDSPAAVSSGVGGSEQQGGVASVTLPQPAGEPASVLLAQAVHLAWVRSPEVALLASSIQKGLGTPPHSPVTAGTPGEGAGAANGGLATQGKGSGDASAAGDENGEAVAALQNFFLYQTRLLSQGDILAVPKQRAGAPALSLPNLLHPLEGPGASLHVGADCSGTKGSGSPPCFQPAQGSGGGGKAERGGAGRGSVLGVAPDLLYFRVVHVLPAGVRGPLAVNAARTEVKLVGSCSSGVPPGVAGYLAPGLPAPQPALEPRAAAAVGGGAPAWHHLAELLASSLHPGGAHLPLRLAVLLHGPSGSGKRTTVAAAAQAVGCHVVPLSCHDIRPAGTPEKKVLEGLQAAFEAAGHYRPAVLLLRHFEALVGDLAGGPGASAFAARAGTALAECIRSGFRLAPTSSSGGTSSGDCDGCREAAGPPPLYPCPLVLVACISSPDRVPAPLRRCFTHELAADAPDQAARAQLLGQALRGVESGVGGGLGSEVLEELARHTAGLLPREIRAVVADAAALAAGEALPDGHSILQWPLHVRGSAPTAAAAPSLSEHHLSAALESVRQRTATDIGAPKIPNVKWEDVGGLEDVKRAILDTVELPLKHPELFAGGLRRRSGVLLYGPPGTGKTLLAKAIATECSINFLSVKGPELINMYVGESERQIREVFARARRARPCVIFFDELDSLAPARGKGSDSGGVMDRVVAQLLAEVDGVQGGAGSGDLFIIGATNRPDLLDPALMRPGRLDRLLYVGIAEDSTSRLRVLEALTRRFALHPGVDLVDVAECCPARFTGADMYALCSDAWMTALRRGIAEQIEDAQASGEVEAPGIVVEQSDFKCALANLQPSLSEEEVRKYERMRDQWSQKPKFVG